MLAKATGPVRGYLTRTVERCTTCKRSCKSDSPCHRWVPPTSSDPLLFLRMEQAAEAATEAYVAAWEQDYADAEHRPC